MEREEASRG
jgi:hypothetical protein